MELDNQSDLLINQRRLLADDAFEKYHFGDDAEVCGFNHWEDMESDDWILRVYVNFYGYMADSSSLVSFHVKFFENSLVIREVYALLVENGGEIGHP